jgi:hypothetical protein
MEHHAIIWIASRRISQCQEIIVEERSQQTCSSPEKRFQQKSVIYFFSVTVLLVETSSFEFMLHFWYMNVILMS